MYFPERILGIRPGDRVLEIGPGTRPHPRSDVLLEMRFDDAEEHARQCGGEPAANADGRTVFYTGDTFPFSDGEFDYVICSHVLEHVDDVERFCEEMFRVGRSGYLEYPLVYYDYVYDIPEHVNVLMFRGDTLVHRRKAEVLAPELQPVRELWFRALAAGYTGGVTELAPYIMQGFEWHAPFRIRSADRVDELFSEAFPIPSRPVRNVSALRRLARKVKALLR